MDDFKLEFISYDSKTMKLILAAERIADFVCQEPYYYDSFCDILTGSSAWTEKNYEAYIEKYYNQFLDKEQNLNHDLLEPEKYKEKLIDVFSKCNNTIEINDLRGIIGEKIVEKALSRFNAQCDIHLGCSVKIDGKEIIYVSEIYESKKTIDIVCYSENDKKGEFDEVKVAPNSFRDKDAEYLKLLNQKLNNLSDKYQFQYIISISCFKMLVLLRKRVMTCGLDCMNYKNIKLYGRNDIKNMIFN